MMEQLFKERKEKLHLFKSLRKKRENERKEVPEGLYTKCPKCKELILTSKLKKKYVSLSSLWKSFKDHCL